MICKMCKKDKNDCSLEPSRSQLYFGGYPIKMEYRCQKCENKLVKMIEKSLKELKRDKNE